MATSTQDPQATVAIQGIVMGACQLAGHLAGVDTTAWSAASMASLADLQILLEGAERRRDDGDSPENLDLCKIACEAAYLLASLQTPGRPLDAAPWPGATLAEALALQDLLRRMGLMEIFLQPEGGYSL